MSSSLWSDIFRDKKKEDSLSLLKSIPIFDGLSRFDLIKVSKLLHLRRYKAGETIFLENEPGESMYIIQSGKVKITKYNKSEDICLAVLESGSFFGEVSIVDEDPRTASATAVEETELLGFFRSDLMHLTDRDPRLASFILYQLSKVIGKRLRTLSEKFESVNYVATV